MKLPIVDNEHVQPLAYLCGPDDYESEDRFGLIIFFYFFLF